MSFKLLILRRVEKALADVPSPVYERIRDSIRSLASDPRPRGSKKLISRPGRRIRVGAYRIIYEIDDGASTVTILDVGHRRDVYK